MSKLFNTPLFLLNSEKSDNNIEDTRSVDVVIPAFNEEQTVADVVNIIRKLDYIDNVIVVNDGSTDNTEIEALNAGAKVINHKFNQGKGSAIKTGFNKSKADVIAFIDADIKNLTIDKVDTIIKPILNGESDLTKTKFSRESGRVTELTAKPLLRFFFPEVTYEQPLSGQFAGKRSILKKIDFENDYGVDVGIVLDADVRGIKIKEVDIGDVEHDMSPLEDLHQMANEVVRTIITRAMSYGRVAMIDSLGNYIRMAILGLSLIILGLFLIFFVQGIPYELGVLVGVIGFIIAVYYLIKLIVQSILVFKKTPNKNVLKSFVKMHFPIIIVLFVLILMISTFMSATTIGDNGQISIEATSRNLIIFSHDSGNHIAVRGPYTVDSAIENESSIIRMPYSALETLQMNYGDTITINNILYQINSTRPGEDNILRLPSDSRLNLNVQSGDVISNSRLTKVFENLLVQHTVRASNISDVNYNITENYFISSKSKDSSAFDIYLDDNFIASSSAILKDNSTYAIYINGAFAGKFNKTNISKGHSYKVAYDNHLLELRGKDTTSSIRDAVDTSKGTFLSFTLNNLSLNNSSQDNNSTDMNQNDENQ